MLSNAYFLAKFCFDTAENEPYQVCRILCFPELLPREVRRLGEGHDGARGRRGTRGKRGRCCTATGAAGDVTGSGKLYRARSRLYRNKILQVNMRLKALAEIYTMHSFAQLCNLNFFVKICQKFQICQKFAKVAKFSRISKISEMLRKF